MELTDAGINLANYLLQLDVEHNWLQNQYVDWLTGKPNEPNISNNILDSFHTHCSSFVACVCYQLHIPFLSMQNIGTEGLANKQCDWLEKYGEKNNWIEINDNDKNCIIQFANDGYLIIVCYHNKLDCNCGHVALVLPHKISDNDSKIKICQAGLINSSCMDIDCAFGNLEDTKFWMYNSKLF